MRNLVHKPRYYALRNETQDLASLCKLGLSGYRGDSEDWSRLWGRCQEWSGAPRPGPPHGGPSLPSGKLLLRTSTNGCVPITNFTGKNVEADSSVGLCSRVVLDLMAGLEEYGFELNTNNYYTSPELFPHLHRQGINTCGTVRVFPRNLYVKGKRNLEDIMITGQMDPFLL